MISILIVDDDLAKISAVIDVIQDAGLYNIDIKQATNISEALTNIAETKFHLLISDILMPLRHNEELLENGGYILLKELLDVKYKDKKPYYIIGLTQYDVEESIFSNIWPVWSFDLSNNLWKNNLKDLLIHIDSVKPYINSHKIETLFVEGQTDKEIFSIALNLFYPNMVGKIKIETKKNGAGCTYVERQLIIWGKTLYQQNGNYLQAVGVLDNDEAGKEAHNNIKENIKKDSAESSTFSVIILNQKHAKHLIPIYQKQLSISIRLEEYYSPTIWEYAHKSGWVRDRPLLNQQDKTPKSWNANKESFFDFCKALGLSSSDHLFIENEFNDDYKLEVVRYIKSLSENEQKEGLYSFNLILQDIFKKLKLKIE